MIAITVFPPSRTNPPKFDGLALQQDARNDFSFQTQYHLFASTPEFTGLIGAVKILKRGQTASDVLQLPPGPLDPLGPDFVSLGQDFDYYERLAGLPLDFRAEVLASLRDALAQPDHAATFSDDEGWTVSVLAMSNGKASSVTPRCCWIATMTASRG